MELIGRTVVGKDGTERDEFVAYCADHNFYYKGQPPLTHGCRECWLVYFLSQWAQAEGDKLANLEQLESAIKHTAEMIDKGGWDFKPSFDVKISHEN
jgi:hypothetical protein